MERNIRADVVIAGMLSAAIVVVGIHTGDGTGMVLRTSELRSDRLEEDLTVEGGTDAERARMRLAIRRFEEAGLVLPPLLIVFRHPSDVECHGALGYFSPSQPVWQISICSTVEPMYEHELAHAWERANLTDAQRERYVALRGLPTWSDKAYDWGERGIEDLAFVVQQGLAGLPLPPALGREARSRLEGYEMLTGRIAPRLGDWLAKYEVPCGERPTDLSLQVPDVVGRTCETSLSRKTRIGMKGSKSLVLGATLV